MLDGFIQRGHACVHRILFEICKDLQNMDVHGLEDSIILNYPFFPELFVVQYNPGKNTNRFLEEIYVGIKTHVKMQGIRIVKITFKRKKR